MDFVRGLVVKSAAGRDEGGFFVVLEAGDGFAVICDGKRRSLEHPKRKNLKHLCATKKLLPENLMGTDRGIRRALSKFRKEDAFPHEEASVCQNRT